MRVGFLVGSVSRQAGGLFQSVRGLAKAIASTNADVRVFGIRDEQSAVDSQEWRPLSVQTFRPRLRAWGYSNELVPAMLDADLDVLSVHGLWKYCSVGSQRWHQPDWSPLCGSSARHVGTMGRAKRNVEETNRCAFL
jgi:hypothetical protein